MKKAKILVHFIEKDNNLYVVYLIKPEWDSDYIPEIYDMFILGGHTRTFAIKSIFNHIKALIRLTDEIGDGPCTFTIKTLDDKLIAEIEKEPFVDDKYNVVIERIGK